MNSLFNIYQSKYRYIEDELLLLFVLLSKLWKVSFQDDNYTNTINVFNLVRYIKKTYKFILENNEENKKTDKEKLNEQDSSV